MKVTPEVERDAEVEAEGTMASAFGQFAPALRVIRAKGVVWIAGADGLVQQGVASLAGRSFTISPGPPWWASIEKSEWPEGLVEVSLSVFMSKDS